MHHHLSTHPKSLSLFLPISFDCLHSQVLYLTNQLHIVFRLLKKQMGTKALPLVSMYIVWCQFAADMIAWIAGFGDKFVDILHLKSGLEKV